MSKEEIIDGSNAVDMDAGNYTRPVTFDELQGFSEALRDIASWFGGSTPSDQAASLSLAVNNERQVDVDAINRIDALLADPNTNSEQRIALEALRAQIQLGRVSDAMSAIAQISGENLASNASQDNALDDAEKELEKRQRDLNFMADELFGEEGEKRKRFDALVDQAVHGDEESHKEAVKMARQAGYDNAIKEGASIETAQAAGDQAAEAVDQNIQDQTRLAHRITEVKSASNMASRNVAEFAPAASAEAKPDTAVSNEAEPKDKPKENPNTTAVTVASMDVDMSGFGSFAPDTASAPSTGKPVNGVA